MSSSIELIEEDKKNIVVNAGKRLLQKGLVERTWGNVSIRLSKKTFAITPTGASYSSLNSSDIVEVDATTLLYKGSRKPSSEVAIHLEIYNHYPNINFVLHTHQRWASLISLFFAGKMGFFNVPKHFKSALSDKIASATYAEAGTKKIAENVIVAFETYSNIPNNEVLKGAVLMASHGAIFFAENAQDAFNIAEQLEEFSKNIVLERLKTINLHINFLATFNAETYSRKDLNNKLISCPLSNFFRDIFCKVEAISYITLLRTPVSVYFSKIFRNYKKDDSNHFLAYFDDTSQIVGPFATFISLPYDAKKIELDNVEKISGVLILENCCVASFSFDREEALCTASLFEKNIYAFLLALHDENIKPLSFENALSLHNSYIKGYSNLKNVT